MDLHKKPYIIFLLAAIIALSSAVYGQKKADSLVSVLKSMNGDSDEKAVVYSQLAKELYKELPDSASYYANHGLELSEKIKYPAGIVKNLVQLGNISLKQDSLNKSFEFFERCLEYLDEEISIQDKLKIYLELGYLEEIRLNLPESISYYYDGLHLAEELGDDQWLGIFKNNLGLSYFEQNEYKRAVELYGEAADHFKIAQSFKNYGQVLVNTGATWNILKEIDSALHYLEHAIEVNKKYDNDYGLLNAYASLGSIHLNRKEFEKALEYYSSSRELLENSETSRMGLVSYQLSRSYLQIGNVYLNQELYKQAIKEYLKGLSLAEEKQYKDLMNSYYILLSKSYEGLGDFGKSLEYHKKYNNLNIIIEKSANEERIREIEVEYILDKERLEHQNELNAIEAEKDKLKLRNAIILLILIALCAIILLLYYLQSLRARETVLKKDKLHSQLEFKKKELTTNVMYLLNKNNFIVSLAKKLGQIDVDESGDNRRIIGRIISDIEDNVEKESWREFEVRFQEVHGDFYDKLAKEHPDLSPNEQKLCAFLRLNMTSKDISALTYQSPESIKVARHRLRKKLGLETQKNLITYLNTL